MADWSLKGVGKSLTDAENTVVDDLRAWLHQPFRSNMDAFSLFLAIGLVLILAGFWVRILSHVDINME